MDQSPFKKLSGELRNMIYEMVLHTPKELRLYAQMQIHVDSQLNATRRLGTEFTKESIEAARDSLALTAVCKEIRSETIGLFYAINRFVLVPNVDAGVGQWGKASKHQYADALNAVREWLQSLPQTAAQSIQLHIDFGWADASGGPHHVKPNRAVLWWKETRKLESSVLYPIVNSANIYAVFGLRRYGYSHVPCTKHHDPAFMSYINFVDDCQWSVFNLRNLMLDIPTADKAAARKEVEKVLREFSEKVAQAIVEQPCGYDQQMRKRLQQDVDTVLMIVDDPVKGGKSGKGKGKAKDASV